MVTAPALEKALDKKKNRTKKITSGKDAAVAMLETQVGNVIDVQITSVGRHENRPARNGPWRKAGARRICRLACGAPASSFSLSDFGAFVEVRVCAFPKSNDCFYRSW